MSRSGESQPFFSLRELERGRFESEFPAPARDGVDDQRCARRIDAVPLAWSGRSLSLQQLQQTGCTREAHPSGEARFVTFAVDSGRARPVTVSSLRDWFSDADLLASLSKDALVRRALAATDEATPGTLPELLQALANAEPVLTDQSCYAFPGDLLERFVPSHVQGGNLAVRLSLPGGAVCRTRLTELGLLLPLPARLRASLLDAAAGHNGFLKRNPPPTIALRHAVIELGSIAFDQAHP